MALWPWTALKFNNLLVLKCLPCRHFCSWMSVIVVHSLSPIQICNPADCSMSGFPVLHYLPEFVQTHIHWVADAIQSSQPHSPLLLLSIFPASGSFPMSQLFTSGGQSIGSSASASVLPLNNQGWFPLGWTGWISLLSKGLSRVFSSTTVWKHQFFGTQSSLWSNSHIYILLPEKSKLWLYRHLSTK